MLMLKNAGIFSTLTLCMLSVHFPAIAQPDEVLLECEPGPAHNAIFHQLPNFHHSVPANFLQCVPPDFLNIVPVNFFQCVPPDFPG